MEDREDWITEEEKRGNADSGGIHSHGVVHDEPSDKAQPRHDVDPGK